MHMYRDMVKVIMPCKILYDKSRITTLYSSLRKHLQVYMIMEPATLCQALLSKGPV